MRVLHRISSLSMKINYIISDNGIYSLLHLHTVAVTAAMEFIHCGIFIQSPSLRQWNSFAAASSYSRRHCGIYIISDNENYIISDNGIYSLLHLHTVAVTPAREVRPAREVVRAVGIRDGRVRAAMDFMK